MHSLPTQASVVCEQRSPHLDCASCTRSPLVLPSCPPGTRRPVSGLSTSSASCLRSSTSSTAKLTGRPRLISLQRGATSLRIRLARVFSGRLPQTTPASNIRRQASQSQRAAAQGRAGALQGRQTDHTAPCRGVVESWPGSQLRRRGGEAARQRSDPQRFSEAFCRS
ncbi:hypothetical protein BDV95DRAFT_238800 [Massariosphaeria phaeospora]|uniref:Uncharacterized protein n=1 Tax=Massariosphaeria phaeospora TaxID=100035 RepID=A0A7C8IDG9_9PLEO|nr:hypothetical protein BDV95DRAFT_238800 [Massariosphaeria phaeospora]